MQPWRRYVYQQVDTVARWYACRVVTYLARELHLH